MKYIGPSQQSFNEKPARWNSGLSTRETIELFENEVDTARQEYEQTIGGKKAGDAPRPKLTVDLRSRSINVVPKEVVPIIISDVERYLTWQFLHFSSIHALTAVLTMGLSEQTSTLLQSNCTRRR